jgi:formylglycine-generating enzyme required for sulfatase activity
LISLHPQSITATLGEPAAFEVKASGSGPFSYQWRKDGTAIPGATTAELLISAVSIGDNCSTYDAVISNLGGSVTSNSAVLTVNQPPVIAGEPVQNVLQGGATATWRVTVSDAETDVAALVVSATSLNEQLLPSSCLTIDGSGEIRTITGVVPSNAVGNVDLVVVVRDGSGAESSLMLHLTISVDNDDHGNSIATASLLPPNAAIAGILTAADDDYFSVTVPGSGILIAWTESAIDTYGYIYTADQTQMQEDNDSDRQANFRVSAAVTSGTYYVRVKGNTADTTGEYTLHTRLISNAEPIQVSYFERIESDINLGFTGIAGTTYYILGSDDLKTWMLIVTMVGTGAENYATLIGQGAQANRYFRVSSAPPPTPVPADFVLIPAGQFTMGDALDGDLNAVPHPVDVSAFFAQQRETTKAEWDDVRSWGLLRGYTDISTGGGKAPDHPVQNVTWYDVLKWCNARSEKEGLTPCYFKNAAHTLVYQTGIANLDNAMVSFASNGYRLPTEAEWEKAARGGLSGKRFSLGDTISHTQANYYSSAGYPFDVSPTRGYHPVFGVGTLPYTSPVGSFPANGYGLYDTDGNVWEWCWDGYGPYPTSLVTDPRGVFSTESRILRGGSCFDGAINFSVGHRMGSAPQNTSYNQGFRTVRSY